MLLNLHVKNIALIREADLDLRPGLNIFTGETGAGKSLLLGSVNLALGARIKPGTLRHDTDYALVELTFSVENERTRMTLLEEGITAEDGILVISRKITGSKSIFRINGEGTTAARIKKIALCLLDIHGQHDHQSLLYNDRQLDILDAYSGAELTKAKQELEEVHKEYLSLMHMFAGYDMDERGRLREKELIEHELGEILSADIKDGEEETLSQQVRKLENARNILSVLNSVHELTGYDGGAADRVGKAAGQIASVSEFDEELAEISSMLTDADALLSDIVRSVSSYASAFNVSDEELEECTKRLDEIRHIESKYGSTPEKIKEYADTLTKRLDFLENYAAKKEELEEKIREVRKKMEEKADVVTQIRKKHALALSEEIAAELEELNFNGVSFRIDFSEKKEITANGKDQTEFMICVNPGEPLLPLAEVSSGGELSRIMLAIKTLLSKNDPVETLVFDEIDSGISGKTAVKVADKLLRIAGEHQVLCITHLAQIAAAADAHYSISKEVQNKETFTAIKKLDDEGSEKELARLLGGEKITEAVLQNARELRTGSKRR